MRGRTRAARAGQSLVELLVALPLAALVGALAVALLLRTAHTVRATSAGLATSRELRHARLVLSAETEALHGTDLVSVHDTSITMHTRVGVLQLCRHVNATTVHVAVAGTPSPAAAAFVTGVRAGDIVTGWRNDGNVTAPPTSWQTRVAAPPSAVAAAPCGGEAVPRAPQWQLQFTDTIVSLLAGGPLLVQRTVRYRHYRSGGRWWLGRQAFDANGWEVVQPVAGPLQAPAAGGMRVRALDASAQPVAVDSGAPDSVRARVAYLVVTLRSVPAVRGPVAWHTDSAVSVLPLRAHAVRLRIAAAAPVVP